MVKELLDIQIQVLLLQYGRAEVMRSLANVTGSSPEEVEKQIKLLAGAKVKRARYRPAPEEVLAQLQLTPPVREKISVIVQEFVSRRFLGERRLVERFLMSHGSHKIPKSRLDALPKVISILAAMSQSELQEIISDFGDENPGSQYSKLAGAIMHLRRDDKP